jgi:hypothetical protein
MKKTTLQKSEAKVVGALKKLWWWREVVGWKVSIMMNGSKCALQTMLALWLA